MMIINLTSNTAKIFSFEVLLPKGVANLTKDSKVKADQVRALDKSRLVKLIGTLPNNYAALIDEALKLHLGLE